MRRLLFYLLILLNLSFFLALTPAFGQNNPYQLPDMYQGRILSWNSLQGLSQSATTAIVQDHLGFIWIGTQDGLNRFDGSHFTVFKHQIDNEKSLSGNSINCLLVDPLGGVLVGTDNGVSRYDVFSKSFSRLFYSKKPTSRMVVTALYIDEFGVLWVGTTDSHLYSYNLSLNSYRKYDVPINTKFQSNGYVSAIIQDFEKKQWVVTKNGLYLFKNQQLEWHKNVTNQTDSAYSNMIVGVDWKDKRNLLVATFGDGIYQYNIITVRTIFKSRKVQKYYIRSCKTSI